MVRELRNPYSYEERVELGLRVVSQGTGRRKRLQWGPSTPLPTFCSAVTPLSPSESSANTYTEYRTYILENVYRTYLNKHGLKFDSVTDCVSRPCKVSVSYPSLLGSEN